MPAPLPIRRASSLPDGRAGVDLLAVDGRIAAVGPAWPEPPQAETFDAVTVKGTRILGLRDDGLEPGCRADFGLLQVHSPQEAMRLRALRMLVVRGGTVVADGPGTRRTGAARTAGARGFHATPRPRRRGCCWLE